MGSFISNQTTPESFSNDMPSTNTSVSIKSDKSTESIFNVSSTDFCKNILKIIRENSQYDIPIKVRLAKNTDIIQDIRCVIKTMWYNNCTVDNYVSDNSENNPILSESITKTLTDEEIQYIHKYINTKTDEIKIPVRYGNNRGINLFYAIEKLEKYYGSIEFKKKYFGSNADDIKYIPLIEKGKVSDLFYISGKIYFSEQNSTEINGIKIKPDKTDFFVVSPCSDFREILTTDVTDIEKVIDMFKFKPIIFIEIKITDIIVSNKLDFYKLSPSVNLISVLSDDVTTIDDRDDDIADFIKSVGMYEIDDSQKLYKTSATN
jgi:hypothetical protein